MVQLVCYLGVYPFNHKYPFVHTVLYLYLPIYTPVLNIIFHFMYDISSSHKHVVFMNINCKCG